MDQYYTYTINIQSDDQRKIKIINQILLFISVVFLAKIAADNYLLIRLRSSTIFLLIVIVVILMIWIYNFKKAVPTFRFAFFLAGLSFIFYFPQPLLKFVFGGLYILLGLLEKYVMQSKSIKIDRSGILVNGFPGKFYKWNEINNLLIRNNLITIDFANNKLYQKVIDGYLTPEIVKEFNDFSASMLKEKRNQLS